MFNVDEQGNITLTQGDSGELVINGLPTDKNYKVYFAVQDEKRKPVGSEINVNTSNASTVTFILTASFTDLLTVPSSEEYQTYYYGIKICDSVSGSEDTLIIGGNAEGDRATMTVYPKQVEGLS